MVNCCYLKKKSIMLNVSDFRFQPLAVTISLCCWRSAFVPTFKLFVDCDPLILLLAKVGLGPLSIAPYYLSPVFICFSFGDWRQEMDVTLLFPVNNLRIWQWNFILQVSPYEDHPCYPCDCNPLGSLSSVCVKDEHHSDSQRGKETASAFSLNFQSDWRSLNLREHYLLLNGCLLDTTSKYW